MEVTIMLWQDLNRNGNRLRRAGWPGSIWREMDRMQREMNRLLGQSRLVAPGFPATNVWSGADSVIVTAEVPGVDPEQLEISVVNETLALSGERNLVELGENEKYHRRERGYGRFSRTIQLPFRVAADQVEASFTNGVLHITLPRAEEDRPKKITVKAA
jgi:HSP20 family protein